MDSFDITLSYWSMRSRISKGSTERGHSKKVYDIFKSHGRTGLKSAHHELAALRDRHASSGDVSQFTYGKAADEALKLLSVIEGTPKRNLAKKKMKRCTRVVKRHVRR